VFARALASCETQSDAYFVANYAHNKGSALRLAKREPALGETKMGARVTTRPHLRWVQFKGSDRSRAAAGPAFAPGAARSTGS
jgi:hypothetical protein